MRRACVAALVTALLVNVPAGAVEVGWTGDSRLAARLIPATLAAGSRSRIEAGLAFRVAPGWYTYWRSPGDAGIPPLLDWSASANVASVEVSWPTPRLHVTAGLRFNVYEHDVVLPLAIQVERPGEPVRLRVHMRYAGCSDVCVPYEAELALDLPAGPADPSQDAEAIARARASLPGSLAGAGWSADLLRRTSTASGELVSVRLRSDATPFGAPELFVDAGPDANTTGTVRLADGGREAWLRVSRRAEAGASAGPLALTLVDGGAAASWTIPAGP